MLQQQHLLVVVAAHLLCFRSLSHSDDRIRSVVAIGEYLLIVVWSLFGVVEMLAVV